VATAIAKEAMGGNCYCQRSYGWQLLLPKKLREEVLNDTPTAGGIAKTLQRVEVLLGWFPQSCKSCDACAESKGPPKVIRAPMAQHNVGAPMEGTAMDVLGPLPESEQGNKYLLLMADYFAKWTEPSLCKSRGKHSC